MRPFIFSQFSYLIASRIPPSHGLGASWAEKWPGLQREQDFQGAAGGAYEFNKRLRSAQLERFGTPPLPKALAKAKATTIMSLLAN